MEKTQPQEMKARQKSQAFVKLNQMKGGKRK